MELIDHHIKDHLESYVSNQAPLFDTLFTKIQNSNKIDCKRLLKYIYNVFHDLKKQTENELASLHLHFEEDFDDSIKSVIAEFIIIGQFYSAKQSDIVVDTEYHYITSQKSILNAKLKKLAICPEGASGNKGGNRIFKNWQIEKTNSKKQLDFYESLDSNNSLQPRTLINCQIKIQNSLKHLFEFNPYAIEIDDLINDNRSFVILNTRPFSEISKVKIRDNFLLKLLETIILFDCENSVKRFSEFNLQRLTDLNKNHKTNFKNLLIVTFGKDERSIDNIKNKIQLVRERFKIAIDKTHTILAIEINMLLNKEADPGIPVKFVGAENSSFWDTLLLETNIRGLYELRSVKMLNLYSLVFNEDIKNYILNDLFSESSTPKFISPTTKQLLLELGTEDCDLLKGSISNILNLFIQLNVREEILEKITDDSIIITSDLILKDAQFRSKISTALKLKLDDQIKTWRDFKKVNRKPVLILEYRDQGNSKYHYFPNIIESKFTNGDFVSSVFIKCIFGRQFEWAIYNFYKEVHKYLNHPIRENYFSWKNLKMKIDSTRPQQQINIDWNLENEFSDGENRETIKIKFKDSGRSKTYLSSDLFIVKNSTRAEYRVEKINELLKVDFSDDILLIQNLDEIQESINIYEKIVDTKQQDEELKVIRKDFEISDEEPGRLWKVLLKNNSVTKGENEFYNELKDYLVNKGCSIVSFFHFKNSWTNPKSESLAPLNKKVFIAICDYLNIPRSYFVIMQRIRNASKQATRQSTRQMNYLLKDLFNDGCFNDIKEAGEILNDRLPFYKAIHPIDELGINENNLLSNLVTLVELIYPELNLLQVEKIEKIE